MKFELSVGSAPVSSLAEGPHWPDTTEQRDMVDATPAVLDEGFRDVDVPSRRASDALLNLWD